MYKLLIVDDEVISVKAISKGIDWSSLPIEQIYEAYDYDEAVDILHKHSIDILITDIEMPGNDGLQLLDYATHHNPSIVGIITTGHANFDYAHKAIQYGSHDYLLKPLDFKELKTRVATSLQEIIQKKDIEHFYAEYEENQKLWDQQIPLLTERFWQDVLCQRIIITPDILNTTIASYNMNLSANTLVLPVLISIEEWMIDLNTRDEEIMEYALRNAAAEIVLASSSGQVIQEKNGFNLILFFFDQTADCDPQRLQQISENCYDFIAKCAEYLHCSLSCYMGELSSIQQLSVMFQKLRNMEKDNVAKAHGVLTYQDKLEVYPNDALILPSFLELQTLLETGRKQEFLNQLSAWFLQIPIVSITPKTLNALYVGYLHLFYNICASKGLNVYDFPHLRNAEDSAESLRSVHLLKQWMFSVMDDYYAVLSNKPPQFSNVIEDTIQFILTRFDEDLSREEIAEHVHLNSAYLSRLFKKETGLSLSDYILKVRIDKAKVLLREPNNKISKIAESVGYNHFSHFAKMFKKLVGQSPQEYRRGYSKI